MDTFSAHYLRYSKTDRFFRILNIVSGKPWLWMVLTFLILYVDYLSGPRIQFPILFIVPIALTSWSRRRTQALLLSVILPCLRFIQTLFWNDPEPVFDVVVNVTIRIMVFITIAYLVSFAKELRVLKGLLHSCSYCGRFKTESGQWVSPQVFISTYSEALLSHDICMDCYSTVRNKT